MPSAGRGTRRYGKLEAAPEMPILPDVAVRVAGKHDQAEIDPYMWVHPDEER
jgi:hypothetical protein